MAKSLVISRKTLKVALDKLVKCV